MRARPGCSSSPMWRAKAMSRPHCRHWPNSTSSSRSGESCASSATQDDQRRERGRVAGSHRGVPRVPPRLGCHACGHPVGGKHPAATSAPALGPSGSQGPVEGRRCQSHRLVQGQGNDGGHLQGSRGRCQGGGVRLHREHLGFSGCLCGARRAHLCGPDPRGPYRPGEAGPGPHPRGAGPAGPCNFDQSLTIVRELGERAPVTVVNSVNPYRIEGQKSGAFEVVDQLGDAPEVHCIPVGNAGNITAYWKGYLEFKEAGRSTRLPRMLGFQAAGAAPIVEGHPIEHPDTVATAIRIGNPASWYGATSAASESGGGIGAVTDDEILEAYRFLASEESVFCEPASADSVAGLLKNGLPDGVGSGATVVCALTGHGLKDPDIAISQISVPTVVDADLGAVLEQLSL